MCSDEAEIDLSLTRDQCEILIGFLLSAKFAKQARPEVFTHPFLNELFVTLYRKMDENIDSLEERFGDFLPIEATILGEEMQHIVKYIVDHSTPDDFQDNLAQAVFPYCIGQSLETDELRDIVPASFYAGGSGLTR